MEEKYNEQTKYFLSVYHVRITQFSLLSNRLQMLFELAKLCQSQLN